MNTQKNFDLPTLTVLLGLEFLQVLLLLVLTSRMYPIAPNSVYDEVQKTARVMQDEAVKIDTQLMAITSTLSRDIRVAKTDIEKVVINHMRDMFDRQILAYEADPELLKRAAEAIRSKR